MERGIAHFNAGEYFECHEVLEEAWTPERGERRLFLQALIHFAVGLYHAERGNRTGAVGQLRKGLRKLAPYLPAFQGIDTARLSRDAAATLRQLESGEDYTTFDIV